MVLLEHIYQGESVVYIHLYSIYHGEDGVYLTIVHDLWLWASFLVVKIPLMVLIVEIYWTYISLEIMHSMSFDFPFIQYQPRSLACSVNPIRVFQ